MSKIYNTTGLWAGASRTDDVPFRAPDECYTIENAVAVILPGQDDPSARLDSPITQRFSDACAKIFIKHSLRQLQLLIQPNDRSLDIVLSSTWASHDTAQLRLPASESRRHIVNTLKSALPDRVGLEGVDVDLSPLGTHPAHVSRLAVPNNQQFTTHNLGFNPVHQLLKALRDARDPFVYQLLLEPGDPINASVRLVTFRPRYIVNDRATFAEVVKEGHPRSLARIYRPCNLTDNHELDVSDHWDIESLPDGSEDYAVSYSKKVHEPDHRYKETKAEADALCALVKGNPEYRRFRRGGSNYHNLYKQHGMYPRFTIDETEVEYFASLVPIAYDASVWQEVRERQKARVETVEMIREASGTDQAASGGTGLRASTATSDVATTGGPSHEAGGRGCVQYFRQNGDKIEEVDQDTTALPDLLLFPTDMMIQALGLDIQADLLEKGVIAADRLSDTAAVHVEVEWDSRDVSTLANAAKAALEGRLVIFVAKNESKAESIAKACRKPFKQQTDHGAYLNKWTKKVVKPSGAQPVLPEDRAEYEWELTHTARLQLWYEDAVIAAGPATQAPSQFEYDCPRLVKTDGTYVVESPAGDELGEYDTKRAFKNDWQHVSLPHVPVERSYLNRAIILYADAIGEEFSLERYHVTPEWDHSAHMERYQGATGAMFEDFVIEQAGAELPLDDWRDWFRRLYRRQTNRKVPDDGKIGEALNSASDDDLETKQRNDPYQQLYRDHTFVFPAGIVSPALPGVSTDDGRLMDWAEMDSLAEEDE